MDEKFCDKNIWKKRSPIRMTLPYSVYKQWCFCYVFHFVPARSFSSVGHLACGGGGARQIGSSSFYFIFVFLFWSCFLCFCFLFDCFFLFLCFIECIGRACRIYESDDDMDLRCPLLCLLHTWQRSISVA